MLVQLLFRLDVGDALETLGHSAVESRDTRKSRHHDVLFRSEVLSTEVSAEAAASVRHLLSMYRSALYNQMGNNAVEHKRQNLITTNSLSHLYCIFATTMEDSISKQLDLGIRFLDLRIAHKTKDPNEVFYFAHGIYSLQTVKEALINVAHWLDQHNKEVVIIALSAFDGMNPDQHRDLIQFLISTFNNRICPNHVTPSLQECWNHSYQVILSYDDSAASGHEELWPQCEYWWANTSDPNRLVSYLEERKEEGRPDMFFAAGLNLTEDARYIITHPCQSMQSMTLNSYGLLLNWVKQQHPGSGKKCLNIICADFVGAFNNKFSKLVIGLNQTL